MSVLNVPKDKALEITINKFERSARGSNDYVELFMVLSQATKLKSGLNWDQVEEVVKRSLEPVISLSKFQQIGD